MAFNQNDIYTSSGSLRVYNSWTPYVSKFDTSSFYNWEQDNLPLYDLEERTLQFAISCRLFLSKLPNSISNIEDSKQLIKSSGSIGANYIEANEGLSKKDFLFRLKISRKEAKESVYWLRIIEAVNPVFENEASKLLQEATELKLILSSIIEKSK